MCTLHFQLSFEHKAAYLIEIVFILKRLHIFSIEISFSLLHVTNIKRKPAYKDIQTASTRGITNYTLAKMTYKTIISLHKNIFHINDNV